MRLSRANQKGFISMEVFLIIVVLALVGGTGYFVYQATKKTNDTFTAAAKAADSTPLTNGTKADTADPTSRWIPYTSSAGKYSLRYPNSWKTATHPEACEPSIFLVGPDADSVGICGSDGLGQIVFSSVDGEQVGAYGGENFTTNSKKDVTIDGATGQRITGTYTSETEGIGYPKGTTEVTYLFSTNGKLYRATYDQEPSGPLSNDALADFDLIVTKTLKFL
jgi:hypothetical protein